MTQPFLPERPLERFLQLQQALFSGKRWFQGDMPLRFAASALVTTPGEPSHLERRLREVATALEADAGWFGPLRSEVRFVVAAMLLQSEIPARTFCAEVDRMESLFKQHGLRAGNTYGCMAILLLLQQAQRQGRKGAGPADVVRMAALYAEMKSHHGFLTGQDDYAACALLSGLDGSPAAIGARCEEFYEGLRDLGFRRGNALQTVSHLLVCASGSSHALMRRFRSLWAAFDEAGLWMNASDYDEVAVLALVDQPASQVVKCVLSHRETIAEQRPRPGRELAFGLACSTAFLELAGSDLSHESMRGTQAALAVQAILAAQQAAMIVACTTAAVAASSASH